MFIAPAYTATGYVRALKEKGITVVEIQHGVINKEHFGYNVYLPFNRNYFPDYLLSFGEQERRVFHAPNQSVESDKVIPTGSFYIDYIERHYQPKMSRQTGQMVFSVSLQDCDIGKKVIPFLMTVANANPSCVFLLKPRRTTIEAYNSKYELPENMVIHT